MPTNKDATQLTVTSNQSVPRAILKLNNETKSRRICEVKTIEVGAAEERGVKGWLRIKLSTGTLIVLNPEAAHRIEEQVTAARIYEDAAKQAANARKRKAIASTDGFVEALDKVRSRLRNGETAEQNGKGR